MISLFFVKIARIMTHPWTILPLLLLAMILLSFHSIPEPGQDDTNKQIVAALTAGNAAALTDYFNSMVDLGIAGNEDTYSKTQATQILKDFFIKNPVKSVKITRQGSSTDGSRFSIGEMQAGSGTFRIYYLLKKVSGKFLIQQLQIQKAN
jgi:Domain of unknown function (DUF4783)